MRLTKLERNQIYEAITRSAADPNDFNLHETFIEVAITHRSGSTFRCREGYLGASTYAVSSPTYEVATVVVDGQNLKFSIEHKFDDLVEVVNLWADEVGRTVEASDLWSEMQRDREFVAEVQRENTANSPFTQREQGQIAAQLRAIRNKVAEEFELTGEQIEHLEESFNEAEEASKRMGRKDWFVYLLGTISALLITSTVAPGVGEHIVMMVIHTLGHLFTSGYEPPRIPPQT